MDKINFDRQGGFPFTLQDLEFNQTGIEQIMKGICQMQMDFSDTYTWIGSGWLNNNTLNLSQGMIYDLTNDELFYVADRGDIAGAFSGDLSLVKAYIYEANDGTAKVFSDGNTWYPRKYRQIRFEASSSMDVWRNLTLEDLINQKRGTANFNVQDGTGQQNFKTITRHINEYIDTNYAFNTDDPYEQVASLQLVNGTLTITMPTTPYVGQLITIYNKSGATATISGVGTLATALAGVYSVSTGGSWFEITNYTIAV